MLILTRKPGEGVVLDVAAGGPRRLSIWITRVDRKNVRIGIQAAGDVRILRDELVEALDIPPPEPTDDRSAQP